MCFVCSTNCWEFLPRPARHALFKPVYSYLGFKNFHWTDKLTDRQSDSLTLLCMCTQSKYCKYEVYNIHAVFVACQYTRVFNINIPINVVVVIGA